MYFTVEGGREGVDPGTTSNTHCVAFEVPLLASEGIHSFLLFPCSIKTLSLQTLPTNKNHSLTHSFTNLQSSPVLPLLYQLVLTLFQLCLD